MNWKFEKEPDKCSKAKKIIIPLVFVIILIVMISWSSQGFAADYIPPNSTISNVALRQSFDGFRVSYPQSVILRALWVNQTRDCTPQQVTATLKVLIKENLCNYYSVLLVQSCYVWSQLHLAKRYDELAS